MGPIRRILRAHRRVALVVALLALALRVLLPSGVMLAGSGSAITVAICADATGLKTQQLVLPGKPAPEKGHAAADGTACPYAALAMAGLGGADPVLLAAALALLMVLGLAALVPPRASPPTRLRPPLRAPPLYA